MSKYFIILFIALCFSCQKKITPETKVAIQPYIGFPKEKTDALAKVLSEFYKLKIEILPNIEMDKKAFIAVKSPRYRADSIIKFQKKKLSKYDFIIGLTNNDISTTKKNSLGFVKEPKYKYQDWGIMGLAYCPGNSCIISSFRLKHKNKETQFMRLKKVTIHEFGHNLGLPHCPNKKCVMTDAVESIATIDNANLDLCTSCKNQIN
jgi:archaemetzincin